MNVKNAIIGFILNLLASGVWQYFSDQKVNPIIVGSAIIWVLLLLDSGRKDPADSFLTKLWQKLVPPKTVKFVSNMNYGNESSWNDAKVNDEPAMQVFCKLSATNMTDESILILGVEFIKPRTKGIQIDVMGTKVHNGNMFGEFPILPRCTTEVCVHFWIWPPIRKEGESFNGILVFVDQFGNKHKVKVLFKARSRGELILRTRLRSKFSDDLKNDILPRVIRRKLNKKGEWLSRKLVISLNDDGWEVKDPDKPGWIYTAKTEDKKLYLYKLYKPRSAPSIRLVTGEKCEHQ